MSKCKWCDNNDCELMSDRYWCTGSEDDMLWCNIIANNAEYDNVEIEDVIDRWSE